MPARTPDAGYVVQCLAGHSHAFEPLVNRYQNAVYAVALNYMRNSFDAQDVVQDAFIAAYCKLSQLRDPAVFGGWLRTIVVSRCKEWLRRQQLQNRYMSPLEESGQGLQGQAFKTHEMQSMQYDVNRLIDTLPEDMRLVTLMYYISGLNYAEIATFLDVPVSTVKGRLQQARKRLKTTHLANELEGIKMTGIDLVDGVQNTVDRIATAFDADERLFTAHAFMNIAGYDHEWSKEGMHPIRQDVRDTILGKIDAPFLVKIKEFYNAHDIPWSAYGIYGLCTSGAPDFELNPIDPETTDDWGLNLINQLDGLSPLLAAFYQKADIPSLWKTHKTVIQEKNDAHKAYAHQALDEMVSYCRLDPFTLDQHAGYLHFSIDPLSSLFTSYSVTLNNHYYVVNHSSPDWSPSTFPFYFGMLHRIINPICEKHRDLIARTESLLPISLEKGNKVGVNDWHHRVARCFVRTMEGVIYRWADHPNSESLDTYIENEYRLGLILCPYIREALKGYEASGQTLEAYLPAILEGIDVTLETQRWKEFWDKEENKA